MTTNIEMTFELFGTTYTRKANGYCFANYAQSESGKTHRISKAEFEAKYAEYEAMDMTLAEIESIETTTVEEIAEEMNREAETDEYIIDNTPVNELRAVVEAEKAASEAEDATESAQSTEADHEAVPAPKAKKKASRAKKNAAFAVTVDGTEVTLTAKQVDFIRHLPDTCFWENGLDSCIWVDCLCDEIGGQFENKPMTVGAMISTICEKGLGTRGTERRNGRKCTCFELTGLGKVIAAELGLK